MGVSHSVAATVGGSVERELAWQASRIDLDQAVDLEDFTSVAVADDFNPLFGVATLGGAFFKPDRASRSHFDRFNMPQPDGVVCAFEEVVEQADVVFARRFPVAWLGSPADIQFAFSQGQQVEFRAP